MEYPIGMEFIRQYEWLNDPEFPNFSERIWSLVSSSLSLEKEQLKAVVSCKSRQSSIAIQNI